MSSVAGPSQSGVIESEVDDKKSDSAAASVRLWVYLNSCPNDKVELQFTENDTWETMTANIKASLHLPVDCEISHVILIDHEGDELSAPLKSCSKLIRQLLLLHRYPLPSLCVTLIPRFVPFSVLIYPWINYPFTANVALYDEWPTLLDAFALLFHVPTSWINQVTLLDCNGISSGNSVSQSVDFWSFYSRDPNLMVALHLSPHSSISSPSRILYLHSTDYLTPKKVEISPSMDWNRLSFTFCLSFDLCPFEYSLLQMVLCDQVGDYIGAPIKSHVKLWNLLSRLDTDTPEYFFVEFTKSSDTIPYSIPFFLTEKLNDTRVLLIPRDITWKGLMEQVTREFSLGLETKISHLEMIISGQTKKSVEDIDTFFQTYTDGACVAVNLVRPILPEEFYSFTVSRENSESSYDISIPRSLSGSEIWAKIASTLGIQSHDILSLTCKDHLGDCLSNNLENEIVFVKFLQKMFPLFPKLYFIVRSPPQIKTQPKQSIVDEIAEIDILFPSGLSTEFSINTACDWSTLCSAVQSQLVTEGVTEDIDCFILMDASMAEISPPITSCAKFWEYYHLAKAEQSHPCFSVHTRIQNFQVEDLSPGTLVSNTEMKLSTIQKEVFEYIDSHDTSNLNLRQRSKSDASETRVVFVQCQPIFPNCRNISPQSVSLSLDYSWEDLQSSLLKQFQLSSDDYSLQCFVLIDEENDEISGRITTASKFWKCFLNKYYNGIGNLFHVHLNKTHDETTTSTSTNTSVDPERLQTLNLDFIKFCKSSDLEGMRRSLKSGAFINFYQDDGRGAAHILAATGNVQGLSLIHEFGVDLMAHDDEGMTPLHYACLESQPETAIWLINQGAKLDSPNVLGLTPLHYICLNGLQQLYHCISSTNSNTSTQTGLSLLHCGCYRGRIDVVEYLLKNGANINGVDSNGIGAIHCAVTNHHLDVVKILIHHGGNMSLRDETGLTPFLAACSVGNLEIAQYLYQFGKVSIFFSDNAGNNALHLACKQNNSKLVEWLGNLGIRADIRNNAGVTAIQICRLSRKVELALWLESLSKCDYRDDDLGTHRPLSSSYQVHNESLSKEFEIQRNKKQHSLLEACRQADINAVKSEIWMGASVDYFVDDSDYLPIHIAASKGSIQLVQWLIIEADSTIDIQDKNGNTALHIACQGNHSELAQWLVLSGANFLIQNNDGNTPLHVACMTSHSSVLRALIMVIPTSAVDINLRNARHESLLHVSCQAGSLECIFLLLEYHSDVNVEDLIGRTPLHYACQSCSSIGIKTLINSGARLQIKDHEGYTPFHMACLHGNIDVAEYLLTLRNCPLNTVTNLGETCLHCACSSGNCQLVRILLESGQDIDASNLQDETPFDKAIQSGSLEVCKYLITQGIDMNRCNLLTGHGAMHLVASTGHLRVAMWLAKTGVSLNNLDKAGMTPFLVAARHGQLELLRWFRDTEEVNVHVTDSLGNNALHLSCEGGHLQTSKWLISIGIDMEDKNHAGLKPLEVAEALGYHDLRHGILGDDDGEGGEVDRATIDSHEIEKIDDLQTTISALEDSLKSNDFIIARKIVESLNLYDTDTVPLPFGKTLLHYGAASGHLDFVQYLIISGKYVDVRTESGRTPLFYAAGKGHLEMVKFLCSHGADPTAKDIYGYTCLSMAIKHHHPDIIQWFSNVIAEKNESLSNPVASSNSSSSFFFTCVSDHHTQPLQHSKISTFFPSDGIIVDEYDGDGSGGMDDGDGESDDMFDELLPPSSLRTGIETKLTKKSSSEKHTQQEEELIQACIEGDLMKTRYLIENGTSSTLISSSNGYSLLHYSCLSGSLGLVRYLVEKGLNINSQSKDGSTPCHIACDKQFHEIALYLIHQGANITISRYVDGMAILHVACARGMRNLLNDIINLPRSVLPILNLQEIDGNGCNLLHIACKYGNLSMATYLLNLDLYDVNGGDTMNRTPLYYACLSNSLEIVINLYKSHASIDLSDKTNCTPLLVACKSGNMKLVRWLYQHGASLYTMTYSKNTALHIAAAIGDEVLVKYLLENGLQCMCHENSNGYSPLRLAYHNDHPSIVELLLKSTKGEALNYEEKKHPVDISLLN